MTRFKVTQCRFFSNLHIRHRMGLVAKNARLEPVAQTAFLVSVFFPKVRIVGSLTEGNNTGLFTDFVENLRAKSVHQLAMQTAFSHRNRRVVENISDPLTGILFK